MATSAHIGSRRSRLEVHRIELGEKRRSTVLGEPLEAVELPFDVLRSTEPVRGLSWTWLSEPPWEVLRVGEHWRFVACDGREDELHVVDSGAHDEKLVVTHVDRLLDTRNGLDLTQCLVTNLDTVELLEIDRDRTVHRRRPLIEIAGPHVAACFPSPLCGPSAQQEAIVVSWRDGALALHRVDLATGTSSTSLVKLELTRPDVLRVAAWIGAERTRIAVGLPGDRQAVDKLSSTSSRGVGRVVMLAFDSDKPRVLHEFFPPRMSPVELEGYDKNTVSVTGWDFGTTVTFVADRDQDSVPDLVVGAPNLFAEYKAFVLSTERGRFLTTYGSKEWAAFGACPTVDATGRLLLVTGPPPGSPENLDTGSRAWLIDLKTGRRLLELMTDE